MTKITSIIIFIVSVFSFSGCSSNSLGIKGIAEPPRVTVQDVRFENFTWQGGNAMFTLNVSNPNAFGLPLSGIDYSLSLNGVEVGKGASQQSLQIPAQQSRSVQFPLRLSFVNMATVLPGLVRQGTMQYQLRGSVQLPLFNIPFTRSGNTRLRP